MNVVFLRAAYHARQGCRPDVFYCRGLSDDVFKTATLHDLFDVEVGVRLVYKGISPMESHAVYRAYSWVVGHVETPRVFLLIASIQLWRSC